MMPLGDSERHTHTHTVIHAGTDVEVPHCNLMRPNLVPKQTHAHMNSSHRHISILAIGLV